jgi:hypothetical protein
MNYDRQERWACPRGHGAGHVRIGRKGFTDSHIRGTSPSEAKKKAIPPIQGPEIKRLS